MEYDLESGRKVVLLSAALCLLLFTATIWLPRADGHLIGSDGLKCYAILRSVAFDRDFDTSNDNDLLDSTGYSPTAMGVPGTTCAIGSPILWTPFFIAAHVVSLALNAAGWPVPVGGVSYLYEYSVCLGTILYAGCGFLLAFRVAARLSNVFSALVAVLALWWASPAIYYVVAEPSMPHGMTVFTTALFLYLWRPAASDRRNADWMKLGFAAALVALVRWQDGVIILAPAAEIAFWYARGRVGLAQSLRHLFALCGSALIGFLPQCVMWASIYGSPLTIPQGPHLFRWSSPHLLDTLFSTRHGLVSWHPVFLIALFGLPILWRRGRALALTAMFMFLSQLYINASVKNWWADDAFGGRRFTGLVPLFILLLASLIDAARQEWQRRAIAASLAILVVWNGLCFVQYRAGLVDKANALTLREMTVDRLLLPIELIRQIGR